MGEARSKESARQIAMVCLEELVPEDDRYRRIEEVVGDWGFVREAARPYYSEGLGRPSLDPTVLLKLMLAGALEGIGSMRELLRVAALRLDLRLFLGYGLFERLPAHQTVSEAQTQRFADGELFERLFLRTVALCKERGLLDGTHLSVDGFHAEANAALKSLRASLEPLTGAAEQPQVEQAPAAAPPQLRLAEPRSGPTPKREASNATAVSTTDADARLKGKPGQRPHLVYRGQVAVDPKARCIVSCFGERAEGHEGDGLAPILDRARFLVPKLASVGADQGYAAERVWADAADRRVVAYIPPQKTMLPKSSEPRTNAQRLALAAKRRSKSDTGVWAYRQRMADAEGVIAELKNHHGLGRVRCRGTPAFHLQLLLGCAAINLKRLANQPPPGQQGVAAAPAAAAAAPDAGNRRSHHDLRQGESPLSREQLVWAVSLCLN